MEQCGTTPIKENECIAIACLNLLRLQVSDILDIAIQNYSYTCYVRITRHLLYQVHAWQCSRKNGGDESDLEGRSWCTGVHTALVALVEGRAGAAAAAAARRALSAAWPLLLPTPQIRAHHLITLLPQGKWG